MNELLENSFNYVVDDKIMNIINELTEQVGSPNYVKTPVFTKVTNNKRYKKNDYNNNKNNNNSNINNNNKNNSWKVGTSDFKATKINKNEGVTAQIDNIRLQLNKLTDKNFDNIKENVFDTIDNLNENDIIKISPIIFNIASTNRFYSETYSHMYYELINKYNIIKDELDINISNFISLFNDIHFVDSNTDYNKFCENNKMIEKRKALCCFFINLMKKNIINKNQILDITLMLCNKYIHYLNNDNKRNEIDELTEYISILYLHDVDYDSYNKVDLHNISINNFINMIANSNHKDYKSLTNKSIFAFMDLLNM